MLDKTFRPAEVEAKHYADWESSGAFAANIASNARPYTIMMPPPNVTGSLHIGHALTFTLQDVLVRYYRMTGRDVLWQPGTDHAGIATQMVVERQLEAEGETRRGIGRDAFLEKVWDWKRHSGGTIMHQLRHLGASADWARERFTMDEGLSHAVRKVFVDLHKEGLIYRDKRLVNWDPKLHTAISDLEVQQQEIKGKLWHFKYPVEGAPGTYIVVATTRPETMLGDTGVAVHPDDDRYRDLVGKHVILPLVGRRIPIVADDYADPETGSGAVKITPAHDFNDFEVGRRHNLKIVNVLDRDARIVSSEFHDFTFGHRAVDQHGVRHADEDSVSGPSTLSRIPEKYRGLDRFEARKLIVADMEAEDLVETVEDHVHMVPHGDRGGVPVEPWLTDQWYADAATLAKPAIEAVEQGKTRFVPKQWENTYFEWMRNIQPWCISRQLWWGHQIPAWYGPDGEIFVEMTKEEAQAAARSHYGKDVALERDPDVLDTWFSSALWPFSTLGWPDKTPELERYYPGEVLITGFDIIFFWVARMMMMGIHFMGEVPFHDVYIHGLVRDAKGQKMSKAKGNVVDPLELIDSYGCDAIRFTLTALTTSAGRDVKLAESTIEGYRNFGTKLWNAARFAMMNGAVYDPAFDPAAVRLPINRWIIGELAKTTRMLDEAFAGYRYNDVASTLYHFTWHEFCDWYIEFAKPVLEGEDEAMAAETRATAGWVLGQIIHLLHPVMPFITEELWEQVGGANAGRLIGASWPELDDALIDPAVSAEMEWVIELIGGIRALRSELDVPAGAKLTLLVKDPSEEAKGRLAGQTEIIERLARLDNIELVSGELPAGAVPFVIGDALAALPLADVIDTAAERVRLEGKIAKLDAEIAKIDKKLENQQFLAKAPEDVVEDLRLRRAGLSEKRERLQAAMKGLSAG